MPWRHILDRKHLTSINDLKNIALKTLTAHEDLPRQKKYLPQIDQQRCACCGKWVQVCQESEGQALRKQGQQIEVEAAHCLG